MLGLLGTIVGVIVGVAKAVWNYLFGRASNPSDDIIFNPITIWLVLGFWIFLICTVINLMMKASDPFASRKTRLIRQRQNNCCCKAAEVFWR